MNEVKSPKKPLLYYYLLMLLVLLLFNLPGHAVAITKHQINEVDYNTFVTMVEKGRSARWRFRRRKPNSIYRQRRKDHL